MNITFYQRKPHPNHFSIEKIFEGVRAYLPKNIHSRVAVCRFASTGLYNRVYNTLEARKKQGDINHVTGDIHFVTLLLKKNKTILTVHDCGFMSHPSPFARTILLWFWLKLPVWRSSVVTVISEATKKDIVKFTNCPEHKIRVIPDFVPSAYQPAPLPKNPKPVLLQIGTKANKNIARLAQALEGLEVQLRIIGKPSAHDENVLRQYAVDYSWASHLSEEELIQEYAHCDMLAFVSTLEGFGMPIIEAQSIGRPVITSNCSSMPEVAGEGACMVDPYDVEAIRQGILKIIQDEEYRNQLIALGRENRKRFMPAQVAGLYYELYQEIASR